MEEEKTVQVEEKVEEKEGRFPMEAIGRKGFVQFPAPIMYVHFKRWWATTVANQKKLAALNWETWSVQWEAARDMILEYGEWAVEGVTEGDAKDDNVPLVVEEYIVTCARLYIFPYLDPKKARVLSTIL